MLGQYDNDDASMDALGLNMKANMYDFQREKSRGKYCRNIIIFMAVMLAAIAAIAMISQNAARERRIVKGGNVIVADYSASSNSYLAKITYANGREQQSSWEKTWRYVNDGETMKIYTLVENGITYATPQIAVSAWLLMYIIPGVIAAIMAVCVGCEVKGLVKLNRNRK